MRTALPDGAGRIIRTHISIFAAYYMVFLAGLEVTAPPGYIEEVWNLKDLSGIRLGFMPLEEVLFALAFGGYWAGAYEHLSWRRVTAWTSAELR